MSRYRTMITITGALAVAAGSLLPAGPAASAAPPPRIAQLVGSAVPFTAQAGPTGTVPGSIRLTVQVWLRPKAQATQRRQSRPGARSRGVAAIGRVHRCPRGPQRTYVRATATVAAVNAAFGVRLRYYRAPVSASAGPYRLRANDRPASVGTGQTIALTELGLTRQMFRTLKDYAAANKMPAPSARRYAELSLGQGTRCGDKFDVEEQLDVEASYDMAPGARQIVVGGDSCNNGDFGMQGLFDTLTTVLEGRGTKPLASVASNSWGTGFESQPPVLSDIAHELLVRAAAEGVGMYFSARTAR